MAVFAGDYTHSLDKNNRLFIPSKIRDLLDKTFLLFKPLSGDICLHGYTPEDWQDAVKILTANMAVGKERSDLLSEIYENLVVAEIDQHNRITISADFCKFANIDKEAYIVGRGQHFEIWNKADYDTRHAEREAAKQARKAEGEDTAIYMPH